MSIMTFDTARRLKEAGFPQPQPAFGQIWYDKGGRHLSMHDIKEPDELARHFREKGFAFAPTATDILFALGSDVYLTRSYRGGFDVYLTFRNLEDGCPDATHENAAEACAAAWLEHPILLGRKP